MSHAVNEPEWIKGSLRIEGAGTPEVGPYCILGQAARDRSIDWGPLVLADDALVGSHTVMYEGSRVGRRFRTGHHVLVREACAIGDDVSIGSGSVVEHHVMIGNRVRLHSNVFVPEFTTLEDDCWIGPNVVMTNARYPRSRRVKEDLQGPVVRRGAKIGANVTLLPGVEIGADALVGAGSVVTRSIPARAVAVGNPARVIKSIADLPYDGPGTGQDSAPFGEA